MKEIMYKERFLCLLLCTAILLSGCQSDKKKKVDETQKVTYRDSFTEEEKASGTAKFDLMENVTVDVQITPAEKYKDGLKKYYMKTYFETTVLKDRKVFADNPILYGKKLSKVMDIVSEEMEAEFQSKKPEVDISDPYILSAEDVFRDKKGADYSFNVFWDTGEEEFDYTKRLYCPRMYIQLQNGLSGVGTAYEIVQRLKDYQNIEVSFFKDKSKKGMELKAFLEELLGRDLSDSWECIPVTQESVELLNKAYRDVNLSAHVDLKQGEEYCVYRYYYDVKGFPFADLCLEYDVKEGETFSKIAGMSTINKKRLSGLSERSIICEVSKNGIVSIDTAKIRMEGDVYKKAEKVISPDTALQKVKGYYGKQILRKPITVTEMSIVYTGYFTDGSEGEIQPTVAPFWRVRVYNNDVDGSKYFVYDAFTGEAIAEGVSVME